MELIIQKCVELGINGIIPVAAERSVVRVKPGEYRAKQTRYQRVACEAAKQSGRGIIPHIGELTTFKTADMSAYDLILVAYEDERQTSLKEVLRANMKAENIAVIIGPEGGLEIGEVESLINKGRQSRIPWPAHTSHRDRRHGYRRDDTLRAGRIEEYR